MRELAVCSLGLSDLARRRTGLADSQGSARQGSVSLADGLDARLGDGGAPGLDLAGGSTPRHTLQAGRAGPSSAKRSLASGPSGSQNRVPPCSTCGCTCSGSPSVPGLALGASSWALGAPSPLPLPNPLPSPQGPLPEAGGASGSQADWPPSLPPAIEEAFRAWQKRMAELPVIQPDYTWGKKPAGPSGSPCCSSSDEVCSAGECCEP